MAKSTGNTNGGKQSGYITLTDSNAIFFGNYSFKESGAKDSGKSGSGKGGKK